MYKTSTEPEMEYMLNYGLKFGIVLALLPMVGIAQDTDRQIGIKNIDLLQGWRTTSGTHMAAVRITLEDGWKTYWRAPSSNGIPPSFDWDGSKNLGSVEFHWPSPKIFVQYSISTIGYKGEFILPFEVTPVTAGEPITLNAQIDFGVCSEVCVPVTSHIEAILDTGTTTHRSTIETALAARPRTAQESNVQTVSCQIASIKDGVSIVARIAFSDKTPKVLQSVIEYPGADIWVEQVALKSTGNTIVAKAELVSFSSEPFELDQNAMRLTLISKDQSIEINGCSNPS
ncbi:MAG: hypothetical protein IME92_09100 [Proteobacteria bacterium]|nr:hypothetical protein [Pseudomonadota bacterium]